MATPAEKFSISLPGTLASEIRRRVGARGVSGFIARAVAHELEREQLAGFLAELDAEFGSVSRTALTAARRAWPKR